MKVKDDLEDWDYSKDEDNALNSVPEVEYAVDNNWKLLNQQPAYDNMINAEVHLQLGEKA